MLFIILKRVVAVALGYILAVTIVKLLPVQTVYPSEANLSQVYRDTRGICYKYEREARECEAK